MTLFINQNSCDIIFGPNNSYRVWFLHLLRLSSSRSTFNSRFPRNVYKRRVLSADRSRTASAWCLGLLCNYMHLWSFFTADCYRMSACYLCACTQFSRGGWWYKFQCYLLFPLPSRKTRVQNEGVNDKKNVWSKMAMFPNFTSSYWFKKIPTALGKCQMPQFQFSSLKLRAPGWNTRFRLPFGLSPHPGLHLERVVKPVVDQNCELQMERSSVLSDSICVGPPSETTGK